jgi:hypothetical protein
MLTLLGLGGLAFAIFLRVGHLRSVRIALSLVGMVFMHYIFISLCFIAGLGATFIFLGTDYMPNNTWTSPPFISQSFESTVMGTRHVVQPGGCTYDTRGYPVSCSEMKIEGKSGAIWPVIFMYPLTIPVDILYWMAWVSIKHGNWFLWIIEVFGLVMITRSWVIYVRNLARQRTAET